MISSKAQPNTSPRFTPEFKDKAVRQITGALVDALVGDLACASVGSQVTIEQGLDFATHSRRQE